VFEIQGEPVRCRDAWWLVDQLRIVGRADEATAAAAIENAITQDLPGVMLTGGQQEAVLAVLGNPPDGLVGLCVVLLRDHGSRKA
jgi:hypothetical protein